MKRLGWGAVFLCMVSALSACTANGGSWIPSNDGVDKATFGFTIDGTTNTFSGTWHDPQGATAGGVVDVSFKGTGVLQDCRAANADPRCLQAPPSKGGCFFAEPPYQSQNPGISGGGDVFFLICDLDGNGTFSTAGGDFIFIVVDTGPYTGYRNQGNPQGNLTVTQ